MPLPGYGNLTSSSANTGGAKYTRFAGPVLVGQRADNVGGPMYSPSAVILVQSTNSLATPGTISTAAAVVSNAAFIYITQTTNPVATSSFAGAESAPPYADCGAALLYDAARKKLGVYSSGSGSGTWLWTAAMTSS